MNTLITKFKNEQNKLSKNLKILLTIHTLFCIAIGLSNIFLNIFIWKYTQNFALVMQFNLISYITQPITFIIGGWISKKKGLRSNLILGMLFYSLLYLFIISIRSNIINYVLLIGALRGIASGFYYVSFNVLGYDYSSNENRDYFFGMLGSLGSTTNMISPLISGYIIFYASGNSGYTLIFIISFILFLIGSIISFYLDNNHSQDKYKLISTIKMTFKDSNWSRIMFAECLRGMRDVKVVSIVVGILIFIVTQKESSIGNYSFFTFFAGLISCYVAGIIINPNNRIRYLLLGSIVTLTVSSIFLFDISLIGLWVFGIIDSVFVSFVFIPHNTNSYSVISSNPNKNEIRIEAIIIKEIFLNLGRITSYLILALISPNNKIVLIFLFMLGITQIMMWILHKGVKIINKHQIHKPTIKNQQKLLDFGRTYYTYFNINHSHSDQ